MSGNKDIATAVKKLSGTDNMDNVKYIVCTVVSVNESERKCDVSTVSNAGEMILEGVSLMAEIDDGDLRLPAIDSTVIVSYSDNVAPFVVQWADIQKWLMIVGNSGIDITSDLIKFNDGSYGGLVKVIELTSRLNDVENALIELKTKYNTHTHTGVTTGGGTSGTTAAVLTNTVTNTTRQDIENSNTIHGKSI